MNNKETLLYNIVSGEVHLSKKDYSFFFNLQKIIKDSGQITINQSNLFDKLLLKYQRQLKRIGYDIQSLVALPWKVNVVESKKEFLVANVMIANEDIVIKSPFNTLFIQSLRKEPMNNFVWNKQTKSYSAKFNTINLKIAIKYVTKHYTEVKFCSEIVNILDKINLFDTVKYWQPTLVKIHDHYYVLASNSYLDEAIKHIKLNDEPKTLYELSQYGITIHQDLITNKYTKFASEYVTTIDIAELKELCEWLRMLNVEHVFTSKDVVYNKELSNDLKVSLLEKGITCKPADLVHSKKSVLIQTYPSKLLWFNNKDYDKIIHLTNSRPIKIK